MTAFDILKRLMAAHGQVPVVVVGDPSAGAVLSLHRGHMEMDKYYDRVIRFQEYYPEKWQHPSARLYGKPRAEWIRYAQQHAPGAAVVSHIPWAYDTPDDEPANMRLIRSILQSAPHLFDTVPGLREQAENIIVLEELL